MATRQIAFDLRRLTDEELETVHVLGALLWKWAGLQPAIKAVWSEEERRAGGPTQLVVPLVVRIDEFEADPESAAEALALLGELVANPRIPPGAIDFVGAIAAAIRPESPEEDPT
jgi:hypothetical protein